MRMVTLIITALSLLSFSPLHAESFRFQSNGNTLHGTYLPPLTGQETCGVVITVHGDGPLDRVAYGYYPLMWNLLRSRGYAVVSWDKPGVGESSGNWLHQSMQDRQQEVLAAIRQVKRRFGSQTPSIGLLGFSQAGWVIPAVATQDPSVDFLIGAGFAINWADQGWYLMHTRLQRQGASPAAIETARQQYLRHLAFLSSGPTYEDYLESAPDYTTPMSPDRFIFALKNMHSDASSDYRQLEQPLLMLLGEDDLNVDIGNTKTFLTSLRSRHPNIHIKVLPNATHALLDSRFFNTQKPGFLFIIKLHLFGNAALSPHLEPVLDDWLSEQVCQQKK